MSNWVGVRQSLGPGCPLLQREDRQGGYSLLHVHLYHTNGKKKLKGSLALMVGGARKPASAGADTSTNVTVVEMTIVLSGPARGWNGKTELARSSSPSLSHCHCQLEASRYAESAGHSAAKCTVLQADPAIATVAQWSQEL